MTEEHTSFIKTPKQFVVVVALAFAVPIALIVLVSQLVSGIRPETTDDGEAGVLRRIKPVGEVTLAQASSSKGDKSGEPAASASGAASAASGAAPPQQAATAAAAPTAAPPAPPAPGAAPAAKAGAPLDMASGAAMMQKYGCAACHAVDKKILGPAYQDVAAKYKGDKDAAAKLVQKVKSGGAGVWGQVPMPPNAAVPDEDVKALVSWILTLKK